MCGKRLGSREKLTQKVGRRKIYSPIPPPLLILGKSKRALNMSTIELKFGFARQQFAET